MASLMNMHSRPSVAPSLATVASVEEVEPDDEENEAPKVVQTTDVKEDISVPENNKQIPIRKSSMAFSLNTPLWLFLAQAKMVD